MKKWMAGVQQPQRHVRRLWLQYGILWTAAVITGLVAVLYAQLIDLGFELFRRMTDGHAWLPLFLTPAAGALCVWVTRKYFPGSEGSGIPQVIASLAEHGHHTSKLASTLLTLRIVVGKIGLSFLAILSGFTIGREGPTVQVGAALMYAMRRFYPRSSVIIEKRLILAGAAAGLAAAFNTPLAGIVFAIEELSRSFEQRASGVVLTTIIFAGVVALGVSGNYTYFGTLTANVATAREAIGAVILAGVLMGVAGGAFCWLLLNTNRWIPQSIREFRAEKPIAFGALCGLVVAVIGIVASGATYGSGYLEAKGLLSGEGELSAFYPLAKMAALVASYLPGIPGGIFAPSLSIGAGFGNVLHMAFGDISLPLLIALAMVGYLAAVTQSPITSFVIVMEMINGHALVISLMATALLASRVSRFFAPPLYEALAERYHTKTVTPEAAAPPVEPEVVVDAAPVEKASGQVPASDVVAPVQADAPATDASPAVADVSPVVEPQVESDTSQVAAVDIDTPEDAAETALVPSAALMMEEPPVPGSADAISSLSAPVFRRADEDKTIDMFPQLLAEAEVNTRASEETPTEKERPGAVEPDALPESGARRGHPIQQDLFRSL